MYDWYDMEVKEEKIDGNTFRYTVGNDIIEIAVSLPRGGFFEELNMKVLNHYLKNNGTKPSNLYRTIALQGRIYAYLRMKYLAELKRAFREIKLSKEKLKNQLACLGHTFYEGITSEEVDAWFYHRYTSTAAAGNVYDLLSM